MHSIVFNKPTKFKLYYQYFSQLDEIVSCDWNKSITSPSHFIVHLSQPIIVRSQKFCFLVLIISKIYSSPLLYKTFKSSPITCINLKHYVLSNWETAEQVDFTGYVLKVSPDKLSLVSSCYFGTISLLLFILLLLKDKLWWHVILSSINNTNESL